MPPPRGAPNRVAPTPVVWKKTLSMSLYVPSRRGAPVPGTNCLDSVSRMCSAEGSTLSFNRRGSGVMTVLFECQLIFKYSSARTYRVPSSSTRPYAVTSLPFSRGIPDNSLNQLFRVPDKTLSYLLSRVTDVLCSFL